MVFRNVLLEAKKFRNLIPENEIKCSRDHLFVTDLELKAKRLTS